MHFYFEVHIYRYIEIFALIFFLPNEVAISQLKWINYNSCLPIIQVSVTRLDR